MGPSDRVLLEGPMGVGKSTFARALLLALGVVQPPEGSPTFAIAHEYQSARGDVVHIDLYRLKGEHEIEDAGIHAYFWDRNMISITEWASLWPGFEASLFLMPENLRIWRVSMKFSTNENGREIVIDVHGAKP